MKTQQQQLAPPLTTAEQIEAIRKVVKYTLWRMATEHPEEIPETHARIIQNHAEKLFTSVDWTSKTVGQYIATRLQGESITLTDAPEPVAPPTVIHFPN